ncbi:RloB family protein [Alsobacter sp. KACC 23698]|uniref:RloB family protein n=1 Tax=Alsobacter sp. KACC 23698 TaxID=3149229 RepID=A0AAU7JEM9_9HYPH
MSAAFRIRKSSRRTYRVVTMAVAYDGQRTEDGYFRGWRQVLGTSGIELVPIYLPSGGNVLRAVELAKAEFNRRGGYDQTWCVVDVDDTSESDLRKANRLATQNKINLCVSNRCFELWLYLHFGKTTRIIANENDAITLVRSVYSDYHRKNKTIPFKHLFDRSYKACANAKWLEEQELANPTTQVHVLVRLFLDKMSKTTP